MQTDIRLFVVVFPPLFCTSTPAHVHV